MIESCSDIAKKVIVFSQKVL
ncbi:hypothetical protein PTD2_03306 [Pseudoalteromonas tunicata D2]|uniref:Uncharacterized protein n=1 Tax=Pseudoalteromonas tunicata D2 TaxID=87626 RepID=A4C4T2_9GAMM|nr:hypothetical protein PTD2_03306 [Pseudoalteromonas tunicata D2]